MLQNDKYFIAWFYGSALIVDGLQQANMTMGLPFNQMLDQYLDKFQTDFDSPGYKILHNITLPSGLAVVDYISLFPITYLNGWGMLAHVEVLAALSHFPSLKSSDLYAKVVYSVLCSKGPITSRYKWR